MEKGRLRTYSILFLYCAKKKQKKKKTQGLTSKVDLPLTLSMLFINQQTRF